ncbi:unnamed protein product, partial [Ectocarpus sp. 12 AP-2014]
GDGLGQGEGTIGEEWAFVPPTPLFKLKPGTTSNSHGIACAQVAGISEDVLKRAREVAGFEDRGEPIRAREEGRQGAKQLTMASPKVQEALRFFLEPPDKASWNHASDDLVHTLMATLDILCGLAVAAG